ncbi:MAG: pyrroline-5-carboxylate reductase [Proteobacteria bacterium]|nr:pyrroline-5-carboxylate reductase [Pseudomonadota bacterium]
MDWPESVGFVGAGNMAEAIARGLLAAGLRPDQIRASDPVEARRDYLTRELGVETLPDNAEIAANSEVVVLAVKPQHLAAALEGLDPSGRPLFLSIVAGCTSAILARLLGAEARFVRSMPNTPALVGSGVSAIASDSGASAADLDRAERILGSVGRVVRVRESLMDAVTGLSGSGPAYAYLFIEALTEAGVREGLPADTARELSARTLEGAARMVNETGEHPAVLRERVSSPGGTTVAGLEALEAGGLRSAVLAAVRAATARSRQLGEG